jgi:putative molybdopterin biosynthesis protein
MRLAPILDWTLDDGRVVEALDQRLLPLLQAIDESRSLAAAIVKCGISYRAGWGVLRDYERRIGTPLAQLERGRGARLTPLGTRVLEGLRIAERRLDVVLPSLRIDLGTQVRTAPTPAVRLRVAASHDLVLMSLATQLSQWTADVALDIELQGSLRALEKFAAGDADLAGFHVPVGHRIAWKPAEFRRFLDARTTRLIHFIDREQGLILPRGNPARVRTLRDVAARGLRFVNRQRGSGTRLLIDQLLRDEGIDSATLPGYASEEFTHAAVAATVASRGADAGFGVRAAAHEYGLEFVPLVRERYLLAVRSRALLEPPVAALLEVLRSARFASHVRRFPGCVATHPGVVEAVTAIRAR